MAKIQVRYNTKSDGVINKWRVFVDGTEFLFNEIILNGRFFSEVSMVEYGELKHNISTIHGRIQFKDGVATITNAPKKKFYIITGLPRSRTAWMSAFMSTGRSICFHEPKSQFGSWETFKAMAEALDYDYIGISDSSLVIDSDFKWGMFGEPKTIVIIRDADEVIDSVADFLCVSITEATDMVSKVTVRLAELIQRGDAYIVDYDNLNTISVIEDIWKVCLPDISFDPVRCSMFQKLLINQHIDKALATVHLT